MNGREALQGEVDRVRSLIDGPWESNPPVEKFSPRWWRYLRQMNSLLGEAIDVLHDGDPVRMEAVKLCLGTFHEKMEVDR